MIDRKTLRLSAGLLVAGFIFYVMVGLLHTDGPANNHTVVFAEYASSASWTAVHLGQFVGMAVIIAGLLVLYFALDLRAGGAAWVAWELSLRRWRLGSTVSCRRWTGSRSSRPLTLGQARRKRGRQPAPPALRQFGGWSGASGAIRASCLVSP